MITLRDKVTDRPTRQYMCSQRACIELCMANLECLLHIALADSDEHIRQLGGESKLLELMNGYLDLAERLRREVPQTIQEDDNGGCDTENV